MPLQNAYELTRAGELRLIWRPRRRIIFLPPNIRYREREIIRMERLRRQWRMIVRVPDGAKENGALWRRLEISAFTKRSRALGRPPRVEMAAATAAEARPSPSPVCALRRFVMLTPLVPRQPLQQQRG